MQARRRSSRSAEARCFAATAGMTGAPRWPCVICSFSPAIAAAVAGFASVAQLENAARAAECTEPLAAGELAELESSAFRMRPQLSWLRDWEFV